MVLFMRLQGDGKTAVCRFDDAYQKKKNTYLPAYCCARWLQWLDSFAVQRLQTHWNERAKRGKHFAEKWCLTSESRYKNQDARRNSNKRLESQRYDGLKKKLLEGIFSRRHHLGEIAASSLLLLAMTNKYCWCCLMKIMVREKAFFFKPAYCCAWYWQWIACKTKKNKIPLKSLQAIDCQYMANPETLCTIFLHPIKGWRGFEGRQVGN